MRPKEPPYIRTIIVLTVLSMMIMVVSCLRDMPETFPEQLVWNPSIAIPLAEDSFGMNLESGFDTSLLQLDTITSLPDWVDEQEVVLERSVDFDLSMFTSRLNDVRRILFRVNLYNGFPNELHAQAYFLDPGLNPVDSLFMEGAIAVPPGMVVGNGEIIEPRHMIRDAVFDQARIEKLEDAASILLRAILKNPDVDVDLIPYYPDYRFIVEIGAMADLTFDNTN